MNQFLAVLLTLAVEAAASGFVVAAPRPAHTAVRLERGPCERRCAVYSVTLYGDGRVVYVGQHFVRKAGTVKTRVEPDAVREIVQRLEALTFFDLKDSYGADPGDCVQRGEDTPGATLTLTVDGRTKTVQHNVGCVGPVTSHLTDIATAIDRVAQTGRWIK